MLTKPKLSAKQSRVLRLVAQGNTITEAARQGNYSRAQTTRLIASPQGQTELQALRAEAAALLAKELPTIVSQALANLKADLASARLDTRQRATEVALRLFTGALLADARPNQIEVRLEVDRQGEIAASLDYDIPLARKDSGHAPGGGGGG